jgi:hypothetical protein
MSAKPFTIRSNVSRVPSIQSSVFEQQQQPDIRTFSSYKQTIFSGGLNNAVGTTRSFSLKSKTHITFFQFSIKGSPANQAIIQLYATLNGQTRNIIRHNMALYPLHPVQATSDEEYEEGVYNFIPPIIIEPVGFNDQITVKCDGNSDGDFCLVLYEEPK